MKASVTVTYKNGILDPQGKAVEHSLHSLGFDSVKEVRIGKYVEVELDESDPEKAKSALDEMCKKLLSNPVTENFRISFSVNGEK
ncbi:MAG: phosphoribosylformylglycinamidine synthase subunit PurS [Nitrospinota bacterium]